MSQIDEKAWGQYQTAIDRQQRLRIVSSALFILSTATVFAIIALNDYYYPGPLELIGLYLLLFLIIFSGILGISYSRHYLTRSEMRWRVVYLQRLRIVTLALVALCITTISYNAVMEELFGWFVIFLVVLLLLVSFILGISYVKHNLTQP